ncbi:hypothetical protein Hanom_Chr12g01117041 [Helianthus anomalus]
MKCFFFVTIVCDCTWVSVVYHGCLCSCHNCLSELFSACYREFFVLLLVCVVSSKNLLSCLLFCLNSLYVCDRMLVIETFF